MKVTRVMMIVLALGLLAVIPAAAQSETLEACAVEPLVAGGGNYGTIAGRVLVDPASGGGATVKFDTTAASNYYFGTFRGHYDIPGDWTITSVHVDASCLVEDDWFPVNKMGNPQVGLFEYSQEELAPGTQMVTLDIADPNCSDDMFFVAAHATVEKTLQDGSRMSETAWALEAPFAWLTGADSWAQYFQVDTAACAVPSAPPVSPPNRKPVANPDSYEVQTPGPLQVSAPGLLGNDSDPDANSIAVLGAGGSTSAGGTYTTSPNGAFTYYPPAGFTGTDSFIYTIDDGTLVSDPATVTIRVTRNEPRPTPTPTPAIAKCYQCLGLDCLLNPKNGMCQPGQDLCYTNVDDTNGVVRTITRGCGSRTDTPPPAAPSDTCKNVEVALLGDGTVCKFYCDGVTNPGCNQPPSLIPTNGRVPPWTN